MQKTVIILQDYKTLQVIDSYSVDYQNIKLENPNSIFKENKVYSEKNLKVKEIIFNSTMSQCIAMVKIIDFDLIKNLPNIFKLKGFNSYYYLKKVEKQIAEILEENKIKTHVHSIAKKGAEKIAKKFGEEAVELVIEAGNYRDKEFKNEAADVLYYYLILLHERGFHLEDILKQLKKQKRKNS